VLEVVMEIYSPPGLRMYSVSDPCRGTEDERKPRFRGSASRRPRRPCARSIGARAATSVDLSDSF